MDRLGPFVARTRIAYFSMEIALRPEIHTYSGGLGILAGDTARSSADLELPVVFVTLLSREGYLRQEIDAGGRQIEHPDPWEPARYAQPVGAMVAIDLDGRPVWIRPWLYLVEGGPTWRVPVVLLDTDLDQNHPDDRRITDRLYGGDQANRLKQEAVLGIGGIRMLRALGFEVERYHLNEGHSALLTIDLLRRFPTQQPGTGGLAYDAARVRERCIFTTHTPVEAGHDRFDYGLVERILDGVLETHQLRLLAGADALNMTRLALNLSGWVNGVAERHAETARRMFTGFRVHAVTNGVHPGTWACPSFARLFQARCPQWLHEPEILVRADQLDDAEVWEAHREAKRVLVAKVADLVGTTFDPDRPILGFARRMTGYKRPDLLFTDLERLRAIARRHPFQVVLAGKAHPHDEPGKELIERLHAHARELRGEVPVAFLPGYDMELARILVAGADVWLNTPLPPLEASGTSGMKAALNGVLNLSVLDGWWLEACIEGRTGWAIGDSDYRGHEDDARILYDKLEQVVLPLYERDRAQWIFMMKEAISKIAYYFNSQRMMRRYATEAYLR